MASVLEALTFVAGFVLIAVAFIFGTVLAGRMSRGDSLYKIIFGKDKE